jgi:hypothetical protein
MSVLNEKCDHSKESPEDPEGLVYEDEEVHQDINARPPKPLTNLQYGLSKK